MLTDVYSLGLVYFELFISASTLPERLEKLKKLKKLMKSRKWKAGPDLAWAQSELSLLGRKLIFAHKYVEGFT